MTQHQILRARRQARRREGMTLIEIMIVVGILAMIASGVAVALLPQLKKAQIENTRTGAQTIRGASVLWISENPRGCPTVEDLINNSNLDKSKSTTDAWETPYKIVCEGGDIVVTSAGPDGQFGSEDDIQ